ncbi:S41 family peptidase [Terrimonas rubra]|uniref:S41 family peptidase n=1 Tax=Terrimonas rubra TaxID=1035890 RepID=A0ABW6AAR5_9BACT
MKNILLSITCFLLAALGLKAQRSVYQVDLAALKAVIEKTKSYKAQIKGAKKTAYQDLYNRLLADTITDVNSYQYFYNLAQLLFPIRDNHIAFYQQADDRPFRSKASIDSFVQTSTFHNYPSYNINIDSLQQALAVKPAHKVEGIYHYGKFYTIGLFRVKEKEYVGIILDSELNFWEKGQVAVHLYEQDTYHYKAIYAHPYTKNFNLDPIEKYTNGSLINSSFKRSFFGGTYTKNLPGTDFVNLVRGDSKFNLKQATNDIQYLLIQSFQANSKTSKLSKNFYDSIKTALVAPYLILDLRNNEGGAEKESNKYYKLLQQYAKKGKIYVLVNNGTISEAEILLLKLKKLKNVVVLGQTTKGMLAYGSNYGNTITLPSQQFSVYATDMKNGASLLPYEDYGIKPDHYLSPDIDWQQQTTQLIKTGKP